MKLGMGEEEKSLEAWLDRHHVNIIRIQNLSLDGLVLGEYLQRDEFSRIVENGYQVSRSILSTDIGGAPYSSNQCKDLPDFLYARPDITTLISDGTDPSLGHCFADLIDAEGTEIGIAPRAVLKRTISQLNDMALEVMSGACIEFYLFNESFHACREKGYRNLAIAHSQYSNLSEFIRNDYHTRAFINELIIRIEWKGIKWSKWKQSSGDGRVSFELTPCDPLTLADRIVRTKQAIYEVAADMGLSASFMATPIASACSNTQYQFSMLQNNECAFYSDAEPLHGSSKLAAWLSGTSETLAASISLLRPTTNAFRSLPDIGKSEMPAGELSIRGFSPEDLKQGAPIQIVYDLPTSDSNPYIAIATILAAGITGLCGSTESGPNTANPLNQIREALAHIPDNLEKSLAVTRSDSLLTGVLGREFIDYWIKSRELELACFTDNQSEPSEELTDWELRRYFETV